MNLFGMSYRLNLPPVTAGVPIIPCRCCALTLPGTPGLCRGHLDSAGDTCLPTAAPVHGDDATNGEIGTTGTSIASD